MRVLVVDEALPWPTDSGKRIRTFELMRRLSQDAEIVFAYHEETATPAEARQAAEDAGLELMPVPRSPLKKRGPSFAWDLFRNVFLSAPYMVMAHRTPAMQEVVRRAASDGVDLVHAEWTPLVANVPEDVGVPVVIAAHNVESQIWRRYLENEKSAPRRAYIHLQVKKVEAFERRALSEADAVVAVSEADGERIHTWANQEHVTVAPNGVDATRFAPRPDAEVVPFSTLFVGSLDWRPNLDAVTFFLDAVWPHLSVRAPEATFTVVGRHPPAWLKRRAKDLPGVTLEASVPDVRPYVARSAVSVVPLRIGGGSRLKICEALSMGRPVVSTRVGAEGLDLDGGIVLADEPEAFVGAVAAAFQDPEGACETARIGREAVLARYEWDRIAPLQLEAWREAVERGGRA